MWSRCRQPVGDQGSRTWVGLIEVDKDNPTTALCGGVETGERAVEPLLTPLHLDSIDLGANVANDPSKHSLVRDPFDRTGKEDTRPDHSPNSAN